MKHLGLFEGIGGFSLAAQWMGWETLAWCEWNEFGQKVLKYHFPEAEGFGDITKSDFTKYANRIDILTGGFPCQPYSLAGKRLGKEDDRHLWPEMLRVIREVQPRWIVGENVFGFINWDGGLVFEEVQTDLETEGYEVQAFILPACSVNAPHKRDRVWFVAHSNGDIINNEFRNEKHGAFQIQEKRFNESLITSHPERFGQSGSGRSEKQSSSETFRDWEASWTYSNDRWPLESPICSRNDGISSGLAGITVSKHRQESLKAYGNAIVPQVAFQIFKAIQEYELLQSS